MKRRCLVICLIIIIPGIIYAPPPTIHIRPALHFPPYTPPPNHIIYFPEETGVVTGSNSADATAYNNGTHAVGVHYPTATEPYRYLYSCVYHSLEEEIYRGYVQFEGWSGTTQPWQIPDPNDGNVAFPAMAMVDSPELEDGTAWVYGVIAYLTGEIKTDAWGGIDIARGEKLRVRAFKIDDAVPEDCKDIYLRDGYYAGAPSITYAGFDGTYHYFLVTVVEYREPFIEGCWNYVDVFRVKLQEGSPPTLEVDNGPFVVMRDWSDEDEVNVVYYTPSTAVYGEFPPGAMSGGGGKYCNLTYLHTVWGWKNGVFGIGYNVAEWSSLSQPELTAFGAEKLEPIKEGAHSNPHIDKYGQNLFLNWTRNMGYPRLEIMRRRRNAESASEDPADLIRDWDPPIYEEEHEGEPPFYIPPCTLSTWSQHNSENLVSDFPQGSAFSVVWTEQRESSSNTEIYLHDRNPWFWRPDGIGFSVSQTVDPPTTGPDFFPQIASIMRYAPPSRGLSS